ncbi:hypothetical protein LOD99_15369 [Oopsacas minuta]|uniref:Fibronectin type-III domain-containing protein n=1 Tax=Oopsacas minuta TaxID=111878 RepID=A0AAV7KD97_9METZ|nr:hypothetical protein LOD99_15369 [Oopsacas minuta]
MSKSTATGKKRRLDSGIEAVIQGGKYDSIDDIISRNMIPQMEGLNLSLDQVQKRLTKLDRENKLLRKETENLKFKSSYVPTSVKIECPKCNHTMDGPEQFITHLEKIHFYVEQECVIDKPNNGLCHQKVSANSIPTPSFGSPLPEPSRPLRTGRIPRKPKPESTNQISSIRQPNHSYNEKLRSVPSPKTPIKDHISHTPSPVFRHSIVSPYIYQQGVGPIDNYVPPRAGTIPRMRFHPNQNSFNTTPPNFHLNLRHTPTRGSVNNQVIQSPVQVRASPGQNGTIARARTAAPHFKTSPKLLKPTTPQNQTEITKKQTNSPIDLTDTNNIIEQKKSEKSTLVVQKLFTPPVRLNMSLPIPQIKVELNPNNSVNISWLLTKEQNISLVANYELKVHQNTEKIQTPPIGEWKVIGMVQAICPHMACTLQRIGNGKCYSFVVRSIDHSGCHGPFSEIKTIQV